MSVVQRIVETKYQRLLRAYEVLKEEIRTRISSPDTSSEQAISMTGLVRDLSIEDTGQNVTCQITPKTDSEFFVTIGSHSNVAIHPTMLKFVGRNVKITVKTID
jgi:hypothetical protein